MYTPGGGRDVVKVLVGNKVDKSGRQVSQREAMDWARTNGMIFIESSAKTKVGIQQVFDEVVQKILENPRLLQNTAPRSAQAQGRTRLGPGGPGQGGGGDELGCC